MFLGLQLIYISSELNFSTSKCYIDYFRGTMRTFLLTFDVYNLFLARIDPIELQMTLDEATELLLTSEHLMWPIRERKVISDTTKLLGVILDKKLSTISL